jgi:hypothetical protein
MNTIKDAKLARISERNDIRCADVEVRMEGSDDVFVAEFRLSKDNTLDMSHIYRKEASREVDWYDNNLHQAYQGVTMDLFDNNGQEINWGERENFKQQIVGCGTLEQDILAQLQGY